MVAAPLLTATLEVENAVKENDALPESGPKVSAFSLAGLRARKALEQQKRQTSDTLDDGPREAFTETDMLLQWHRYAQRMSDRGQKIMESLLLLSDPKLEGSTIYHELPNEGSRIDFESGKHDLVGYLRVKLHNSDIEIHLTVNESQESKRAFTPQERFNRLNQINPHLDLLRRTFDLDFS